MRSRSKMVAIPLGFVAALTAAVVFPFVSFSVSLLFPFPKIWFQKPNFRKGKQKGNKREMERETKWNGNKTSFLFPKLCTQFWEKDLWYHKNGNKKLKGKNFSRTELPPKVSYHASGDSNHSPFL
jgi:hypothetical protein